MQIIKCVSTIDGFSPEKFKKLGIGVEVQDFTEPNLKDDEIKGLVYKYRGVLEDFPYIKSIHGPFLDLKPSSPDRDIRKISYEKYYRTIQIAQELDMDYIIFHSQINPWLNEPYIRNLNNNQNKDFWHNILGDIGDFQGKILLENVFEKDPWTLRELIETIDLPNIRICLDIGHAKLMADKSLETWVEVLGEYMEYIHFHWNNGLYDEHNRPREENIIYIRELLLKYKVNPILALEYMVDDLEKEINKFNY